MLRQALLSCLCLARLSSRWPACRQRCDELARLRRADPLQQRERLQRLQIVPGVIIPSLAILASVSAVLGQW
jgi:hypothetical protein